MKIDQTNNSLLASGEFFGTSTIKTGTASRYSAIQKNASGSSDFGTILNDVKADGTSTRLNLNNGVLTLQKRDADGNVVGSQVIASV